MIALMICVSLGQLKEGDSVYVKPPGANAWRFAGMASARYREPVRSYPGNVRPEEISESDTTYFQAKERLSVLTVERRDGETLVKIKDDRNKTWWMISTDLGPLDDASRDSIARDQIAAKLHPFCITKPDHAALAAAAAKGIDPLKMTAEQAASLTPGQRKALAGIKARYQRAKK